MTDAPVMEKKIVDASAPAEEQRKVLVKDMVQTEYAYAQFSVTVPVEFELDDMLKPEAWGNVAFMLTQDPLNGRRDLTGAIIELRREDHAFYARLYVRAVRMQALDVALIGEPVYFGPKSAPIENKAYKIRWVEAEKGYQIIRKSDNAIVGRPQDFKLKEHALRWISEGAR